ncbi:hypothetical protein JYT16_00945 [Gemmatimonas aurantiaca]|nr:hypothetical protein [Gemmatimonas aurantiaca]
MAEDKKIDDESFQVDETPAKSKSDLMMYVIVGVGALVVTIASMMAFIDMSNDPTGGHAEDSEDAEEYAYDEDDDGEYGNEELQLPDIFSELDNLDFLTDTNFAEAESTLSNTTVADKSLHATKKNGNQTSSKPKQMSKKDSVTAVGWLEQEKAKLASREKELNAQEKKLTALENEVDQKLKKVDQIEANRLNGLAKLYNSMKHDQVARMIVKLNDDTIVRILPRMKTANAAKILGLLPPARGARISQKMITLTSR